MARKANHSSQGRRSPRRQPGRPGGTAHRDAVRAALLGAARELFARRDFNAVSVRDIAATAGVSAAMVHYHFGDKRGLYRAMLEETMGPLLARVQAMAQRGDEVSPAVLGQFMGGAMAVLAREPWVAQLVVREVLAEDGAFRDLFVREFAVRGGGQVPALLRTGIERGAVRRDLDPTLGGISFMSLVLFPFFALPVVEKVFGVRMDEEFAQRLAAHSARLLFEGIGVRNGNAARKRIKEMRSET